MIRQHFVWRLLVLALSVLAARLEDLPPPESGPLSMQAGAPPCAGCPSVAYSAREPARTVRP